MLAIKGLFAFLFLVSLGFGLLNISGSQASYNPSDSVNLTITNNNSNATGYYINVIFTNSSTFAYNFSCAANKLYNSSQMANANCTIPSDLANGTWNISVYGNNDPGDTNNSVQFTLNSINMTMNISAPKTFLPGATLVYYINTTYQNGTQFSINTSTNAVNITVNVTTVIYCSNSLNTVSIGYYNGTCTVNVSATPGDYLLRGIYPNSRGNDSFTVNTSFQSPNVVTNVSSLVLEKGNSTQVNISIRSNSNVNDTLNVSISGDCDGKNLTCAPMSVQVLNISAFSTTNVTLSITANSSALAGAYTVWINVTAWNSTSYYNQTSISATVNPLHTFTITTISAADGSASPGQAAQHNFTVTNTGDNTTRFNFSCSVVNSANFSCSFNTTNNSVDVASGGTIAVILNVTVSSYATTTEIAKTNVTVTDSLGRSQLLAGNFFQTTALANLGNVTVTNISQYVHYAGETYNFNISINNTGNFDGNDTIFNITVVAQNTTGWTINVSNGTHNLGVNDTATLNFLLNIGNLSSKNVSVQVIVPAAATYLNSTKLFINATSVQNATRTSENASILIKIPYYNFSVNMEYNNASEMLNWSIVNVTREPGIALTSFLNLSYNITQSNGTLQIMNTSTTLGTVYQNSTINITGGFNWPSGGYVFNVWGNTSGAVPYNFVLSAPFYIARTVALSGSVPASVDNGQSFNVTVSSLFGGTTISTNTTTTQYPAVSFYSGGGTCPALPTYITNSTYIYTCTASTSTNASYSINISSTVSYCSRWFNCTFSQAMFTKTYISVSEFTVSGGGVVTPGAGTGGSNTTTNTTIVNRTISTTTGLKFTIPSSTITLQNNSYTFSIALNNTNNSRQNLSVAVSENGAYLHFKIAYIVPLNISGNSVSSLNITLTPFKWSKPGTYTISVRINSATVALTISVPQPNDTKTVHRYVEVSSNRTMSNVTLVAKNRNTYSVIMNITESLPKQIAQSITNMTILSDLNYTVIEEDPVIMWNMNMTPNQEKTIAYSLKGDLGDSNLFNEPALTEVRIITPTGGGVTTAGGGDWTTIIIVIVVLLAVAGGVVFYFFFMRKRGEKMPFNYAVFLGEVKKEKGIFATIKNLPSALVSAVKGKAKEGPKPIGPSVGEKVKGVFGRLKRKKTEEKPKEVPKTEAKGVKPKPSKEELLDKLKEVYKK